MVTGSLKLWAYLRKSFDALKCLLMHQPMIVAYQGGEHACNIAQNCGLGKFHISTILAYAKRILMVLRDLICKKNKFTVFSLTFKRLSPTYIICFSSSSASFAWHKILNSRIFSDFATTKLPNFFDLKKMSSINFPDRSTSF